MKILQHARFGAPEEVLELLEEPDPVPQGGEVLIAVEAAPIHAGDLKNILGEKIMFRHAKGGSHFLEVQLPQVPGIEGIGRVVRTGDRVKTLRCGDRVFLPRQCGSWRSHLCVGEDELLGAPEGDAVQLSLMVNAFTAEFALRDLAPLKAGDWFLQNGANSNVGRILISRAAALGIRTVNIVRREAVVGELKTLGADVVVLDGPELAQRVHAATGGADLTIALDAVGGAATGRLAECLADGGTVAHVGSMSDEPCHVPTWLLLYRRVRLIGYYAGYNIRKRTRSESSQILSELAHSIAVGELHTKIAATYPLERYTEAVVHAARSGNARDGKVVFKIEA